MAGSHDDGRIALNFKTFIKKTGIARREVVPAAPSSTSDPPAEGDTFVDRDEADSGRGG